MGFDVRDGRVHLELDPESGRPRISAALRELYLPRWLADALGRALAAEEMRAFEDAYWSQVAEHLSRLAADPRNWLEDGGPAGQARAKVGTTSIAVKEILLVTAGASVPIFVALTAFAAAPALPLAVKAGTAIAPALYRAYRAIHEYTPAELDVHGAVVAAMARHGARILTTGGATLEEIRAIFAGDPRLRLPASLSAVLADMVEKKLLLRSVAGGVEAFRPNPF
jgi:hypothetical protein